MNDPLPPDVPTEIPGDPPIVETGTSIRIPDFALIVLIGASGSGKSTFARKHFSPTEILSSDHFRAMVCDDETDQSVSGQAFELLHSVMEKRLRNLRLTVIDATNVLPDSRKSLLEYARRYHTIAIAIVLNVEEEVCHERNQSRGNRNFGRHVVRAHTQNLKRSLSRLRDEGFRSVYTLGSVEAIASAVIVREPLRLNKRSMVGPFDIVGDVHGCLEELHELLDRLGWVRTPALDPDGQPTFDLTHPEGRTLIFVGDLVDRGPDTPGVLRLVHRAVEAGVAWCVRGNHDDKLARKLAGRDVNVTHGLAESLAQLETQPPAFLERMRDFIEMMPLHLIFDGGNLVVAHAGLKAELQGRVSDRVRAFCLFGETTGEIDDQGLPVRIDWAADYRGKSMVVYGHTPTAVPFWVNRTICVDTGCVFGGTMTAMRYPSQEIVSVPARAAYAVLKRGFITAPAPVAPTRVETGESPALPSAALPSAGVTADDLPSLDDVIGRKTLETRLMSNIQLREGQSAAALETLSRFGVNPRWVIYLPPTMPPGESSALPEYLEHPHEVLRYFAKLGIPKVVCEQKHMGSRAVVVIGRDEAAVERAFGIRGEGSGIVLTRTGRRFFNDPLLEAGFLDRIRESMTKANYWERFGTDWFCLDGELMPWSDKARELLRTQYAAAGASAAASLPAVVALLEGMIAPEAVALKDRFAARAAAVTDFVAAYRQYCWTVESLDDLRYAPFHLLASRGKVHLDRDQVWHMDTLAELAGGILMATPYLTVDPSVPADIERATAWWLESTGRGNEGMVVKPMEWCQRGQRGLAQPALKCRGREYLRIIYGPEYTLPENLMRLKNRHTALKYSLALREFALGIESLERFVGGESLRRVHECVFGVLALESEAVDARL